MWVSVHTGSHQRWKGLLLVGIKILAFWLFYHFLFSRGSGDSNHLGHGSTSHALTPCVIKTLTQHHVKDIAAGSHHCLALTDQGEVFGWGANTNREVGAEAGESIPVPTLLSEASKCGVVYIACGSHEVGCVMCLDCIYGRM